MAQEAKTLVRLLKGYYQDSVWRSDLCWTDVL